MMLHGTRGCQPMWPASCLSRRWCPARSRSSIPCLVRWPSTRLSLGATLPVDACGTLALLATDMCRIMHGAGSEQVPQPASDAFVKAKVVDWSQRRYALGCYSSPSLGEPRAALCK